MTVPGTEAKIPWEGSWEPPIEMMSLNFSFNCIGAAHKWLKVHFSKYQKHPKCFWDSWIKISEFRLFTLEDGSKSELGLPNRQQPKIKNISCGFGPNVALLTFMPHLFACPLMDRSKTYKSIAEKNNFFLTMITLFKLLIISPSNLVPWLDSKWLIKSEDSKTLYTTISRWRIKPATHRTSERSRNIALQHLTWQQCVASFSLLVQRRSSHQTWSWGATLTQTFQNTKQK